MQPLWTLQIPLCLMQRGLYQNILLSWEFLTKILFCYLMQKTFNLHMFELWIPPHGKQFYSRLWFNEEILKLSASLELCVCRTCFLVECSNYQLSYFSHCSNFSQLKYEPNLLASSIDETVWRQSVGLF